MITEATRSTSTLALDDPPTTFDVSVVFVPPTTPGGQAIFRFFGLTGPNNAKVLVPEVDFILTLSINGPGTVVFANSPITWYLPGDQSEPIPQPDYITNLAWTDDQITFVDVNPADSPKQILVSFLVNVMYTAPPADGGTITAFYDSRGDAFVGETFVSHDPTIINVDPTGSGNLTPAGA
jgi:hypothetical protein